MKVYFKILNLLIVIFFLGIILLPSANELFGFVEIEKGNENRTKSAKPVFDRGNIDSCIKLFDTYYTDNFNLRENFIKNLNQFEYSFYGVSAVPNEVVIGKEGWLYEKKSAANYKGTNCFTKEEMIKLKDELTLRTTWASNRGIKYYVVVVPNKMNIYPEYLPRQIIKLSALTRYEQVTALDKDSILNIIDLKQNIIKHKKDGYDLYQRTDDHWNELGAYYGYQEIFNRLSVDFPDLKPFPLEAYTLQVEERPGGNMARMINAEKDYPEHFIKMVEKNKTYGHDGVKRGYKVPIGVSDWDAEIVKQNDSGKKLKCLVIRDSFTILMIKYFQEHFRECVFLHDGWTYQMHEDVIRKEKPDIILNIVLETELKKLIDFPFSVNNNKIINIRAYNGKYICSEKDHFLRANREHAFLWETYNLIHIKNDEYAIVAYDNHYICNELNNNNEITATRDYIGLWETFTLITLGNDFFAFKSKANNKYLRVDEKSLQLFANGNTLGKQETFKIEIAK